MIVLLTPCMYVLLPMTLGACKVRISQLVRGVCYGLPASMFVLWGLTVAAEIIIGLDLPLPGIVPTLLVSGVGWVPIIAGWQFLWWAAFNRFYLRLPHAGFVAAAMVTTASLVMLVALAFTPGIARVLYFL